MKSLSIRALLLACLPLTAHAAFAELAAHDVTLFDQDGKRVHFYADLVKGHVVAINSIFTTCTTICTPMGANFAAVSRLLGDRAGRDVNLISISLDPDHDTPEQLKAWQSKFRTGSGWTLLTGTRHDVDSLLQELGLFTRDIQTHSSLLLLGDDRTGEWTRLSALAPPDKTVAAIEAVLSRRAADSPAAHYFTDVPLIDQDGVSHRLYSDLLKDKVVVINSFFSTCQGSCPAMAAAFVKIQNALGDKLGREVNLISISVDPETDTPAKLKEYAERFRARPGWYFLTGSHDDVQLALRKIGQSVDDKNSHATLFLIGNDKTGLWKKAFGLANPDEIMAIVNSVLDDRN